MQFRVLVELWIFDDDGVLTLITASEPRSLLALLIMNANRTVTYPVLVTAVCGDAQPVVPDAVLQVGRHLEVLAGSDALVESEPLREHLRAQQVAALYRAGRQAEALRASEALRTALRDELGVEPSLEMVDLERRVLDQDPTLL